MTVLTCYISMITGNDHSHTHNNIVKLMASKLQPPISTRILFDALWRSVYLGVYFWRPKFNFVAPKIKIREMNTALTCMPALSFYVEFAFMINNDDDVILEKERKLSPCVCARWQRSEIF